MPNHFFCGCTAPKTCPRAPKINICSIQVAGGKGVMRSMICEAEFTAEVIPVDQAIAGLIGIAYTIATTKTK